MQARAPSQQPRFSAQHALDGSGQFGSAGQVNGAAGIDMSPGSNQDLSATAMLMGNNFASIIAHETSNASGLELRDAPLCLNLAKAMAEINAAQTASVTPDSASPAAQEEYRARGMLRCLCGRGPRCNRLPDEI